MAADKPSGNVDPLEYLGSVGYPHQTHSLPLPEQLGDFSLELRERDPLPPAVAVRADAELAQSREISEGFLEMLERELTLPRG